MPTRRPSYWTRTRTRLRTSVQWFVPVLKSRSFWLGLVILLGSLAALYLLLNSVVMPHYTRQDVAVTVPEVRELPYEQALTLVEGRRLRAERRDQPFNPAFARDVVVDQNPSANASVKPGRRIYLYVNSGTERSVTMPEVRTLTESVAKSQLADIGLTLVEVRIDETPSPYPGTVMRQDPSAGGTVRTTETVTLWVSGGMGDGTVEIPDVRGLPFDDAAAALREAGLWIDPTRTVSGTVTRQEPGSGAVVRRGTEVRLSSVPIDDEPEPFTDEQFEEGIPDEDIDPSPPEPPEEARDRDRLDW